MGVSVDGLLSLKLLTMGKKVEGSFQFGVLIGIISKYNIHTNL